MGLIRAFNRERGITVLMVTHDPDVAAHAGRVIRFVDGRLADDRHNGEAG
jgi:putative ABC transport system ATP-binding protein